MKSRSKTLTVVLAWTFIFYMMAVTAWAGDNTWTRKAEGFSDKRIYDVVIDPSNADVMYAGTGGAGCYKTTDGGINWTESNTGLTNLQVYDIGIAQDNSSVVYAGTLGGGVYRSTNGAGNWTVSNSGLTNLTVNAIAISSSQNLFAGTVTSGGGFFRSTDGATSWDQTLTVMFVEDILISPHNPQIILVGISGGLYISTDGGQTFPDEPDYILPYDPNDPNDPNPPSVYVTVIVGDPLNEGTFYVGMQANGVYKTVDNGLTWTSAGNGLPNSEISSLTIIESAPHVLYAGTKGGEVYRTGDGGDSWTSVSTGLPAESVNVLASKPGDQEVIYAGTRGEIYEFTYIPPGDINGDGKVDLADAVLLLKITADLQIDPETIFKSADPNDDGYLGIDDAIFVLQSVAGL